MNTSDICELDCTPIANGCNLINNGTFSANAWNFGEVTSPGDMNGQYQGEGDRYFSAFADAPTGGPTSFTHASHVPHWHALYGTPDIFALDSDPTNPIMSFWASFFMPANEHTGEAAITCVNLDMSEVYILSYKHRREAGGPLYNLHVRLSNIDDEDIGPSNNNLIPEIEATPYQEISLQAINSDPWDDYNKVFSPNAVYSNLYIYPKTNQLNPGWHKLLYVDDIINYPFYIRGYNDLFNQCGFRADLSK